jgi:WASH complex subunit 7
MSTAVSVTYQFLKEKVHLFSQFLFDEMIKSRLYRDLRAFQELKKEKSNNYYPYERAKKFLQYVRQLGSSGKTDRQSYLDKFRRLITEMGNAMGYVRMIRSGGLLYTSTAIQFVPDLNGIQKFEDLVTQSKLSAESTTAAHNLDGVVDTLSANFASGTDYYKMLVNVFKAQYDAGTAENAHLANFHLSVPALTLSFIEHISQDKERFAKRRAEEGVFTDDGFAVGVAYLLKLTGTEKDFDALNWFQSARQYYSQEMQASAKDRENVKISALTRTKLQSELREFELLRFTFQAARIFFHD